MAEIRQIGSTKAEMLAVLSELEGEVLSGDVSGFLMFVEREEIDPVAAGMLSMEPLIPALTASLGYVVMEAIASVRDDAEDEA